MKLMFIVFFMWPLIGGTPVQINSRFIIWNVGQGSWSTFMDSGLCLHFDSGGDRRPNISLLEYCKTHQHYLSHLDQDHVNYIHFIKKLGLCRHGSPIEPRRFKKQMKYEELPECLKNSDHVKEIKLTQNFDQANDKSRIFLLNNWALIPGDSTKRAEKIWSQNLNPEINVLLVGHHGSNTSTGEKLITRIPNMKLAISSARKRKYGHPHPKTRQRINSFGFPLISTEDWGNIVLESPSLDVHSRLSIPDQGLNGRNAMSKSRATGS